MTTTTTSQIRERLAARGLSLPRPWQFPPDARIPASLVRVVGSHAWVSGHVPLADDGTIADPRGRVGAEVDLASAQTAAVRTLLAILASVDAALGGFERIRAWDRLFCVVNTAPGFDAYPAVFNPASQLLLDLFGKEAGLHARVAIGVAGLPWNVPVEIVADVELL